MDNLKLLIRVKGFPMWKIAEAIGISEMTLYRWMRKYDAVHYNKIKNAIMEIEKDGENNDADN